MGTIKKRNTITSQMNAITLNVQSIHPDNPLVSEMNKRYRELQNELLNFKN